VREAHRLAAMGLPMDVGEGFIHICPYRLPYGSPERVSLYDYGLVEVVRMVQWDDGHWETERPPQTCDRATVARILRGMVLSLEEAARALSDVAEEMAGVEMPDTGPDS